MENASKALLMAGGVLIALIIIALLVKSFSTVQEFQMSQLSEEEQKELITFNEQFTKYSGQYVYGTEVITTINKALNLAKTDLGEPTKYPIKIKVIFATSENVLYKKVWDRAQKKYVVKEENLGVGGILTINTAEGDIVSFLETDGSTKSALDDSDSISRRAFKCTEIGYNSSNGRVNSITFEEKKWNNISE